MTAGRVNGLKPSKCEMMGRGVGARVGAAQSAGIGQRVLDRAQAPAFLVKHALFTTLLIVSSGFSSIG